MSLVIKSEVSFTYEGKDSMLDLNMLSTNAKIV